MARAQANTILCSDVCEQADGSHQGWVSSPARG